MKRFFVCLLLFAGLSGCDSELIGPDGLEIAAVEVTPTGPLSDSVSISVTTVNASSSHVTYDAAGWALDLVARNGSGDVVWRRFEDGAWTLQINMREMEPGETITWTSTWALNEQDGDPVPSGNYTLVGHVGDIRSGGATLETDPIEVEVGP